VLHVGIRVAGQPEPAIVPIDSVVVDSLPPPAAAFATLAPGALVLRVNGDTIRTWGELFEWVTAGPDTLRLDLAGEATPLVVGLGTDRAVRRRAWDALVPRVPPSVGLLIPGDPGYRAGLKAGDVIVRVDGDTVRWWSELVMQIRRSPGDTLALTVLRGSETVALTVVPKTEVERDAAGEVTAT
jgi:regulator of sigma E protease